MVNTLVYAYKVDASRINNEIPAAVLSGITKLHAARTAITHSHSPSNLDDGDARDHLFGIATVARCRVDRLRNVNVRSKC